MRFLIIDDDPTILSLVASLLVKQGHDVDTAEGLAELEMRPERLDVDMVILDYRLGRSTGLDVVRLLMTCTFSPRVILLSAADRASVMGAVELGRSCGLRMLGILEKPLDARALLRIIEQLQASLGTVASCDIHAALKSRHFLLAYQPKFCLSTGRVTGVEALARWEDPELGLVPPDRFISAAEKDGQIIPLTWQLVDQALAQQYRWRRAGISLDMAINLSPAVLEADDFLPQFLRRLEAHEVPSESLTLELTETQGIRDMDKAVKRLSRLRDLGFNIAIDDFGTGNASMLQLYRLPFTQLKIDRSFVANCTDDDKAHSIILMVVELARRIGLDVVAEGIETPEQSRLLKQAGCHTGQGYFFSRPMYADRFESWYGCFAKQSAGREEVSWRTLQRLIQQCHPA
ncbi:EAL domain-containing response regulator [Halomonas sp.]|uniref:EAL domain-containing response regulator n=1 Tax=Halomonas sp. TaxID=1486246 RepID=UPI0025B8EA09|nr:EAL domain-containing response regulator [Halomonas sp.]